MRLIDADALMKKICENECGSVYDEECENAACNFYDYIMDAPTIEPEVRCGRWILCKDQYNVDNDNGNYAYYCSCCKHQDVHAKSAKVSFCWNCGAKMDLRTPTEVDLDIVDSVMMGDIKHGD